MEQEYFKKIIELDGYEISNYGNVRSNKNKIMTPQKGTAKSLYVCLLQRQPHKKSRTFFIKNLVAEHFIRKLQDGEEVTHIDGDVTNNHVHNLKIGLKYISSQSFQELMLRKEAAAFCQMILDSDNGTSIQVSETLKKIAQHYQNNCGNYKITQKKRGRYIKDLSPKAERGRLAMKEYRMRQKALI